MLRKQSISIVVLCCSPLLPAFGPTPSDLMGSVGEQAGGDSAQLELLRVEEAAFRVLMATGHRIYKSRVHWRLQYCFGSSFDATDPSTDGRRYSVVHFATHSLSLVELFNAAQVQPSSCWLRNGYDQYDSKRPIEVLRDLLLWVRDIGHELDDKPDDLAQALNLTWWENEYLPKVAAAFSCGFADDDEVPGQLKDGSPGRAAYMASTAEEMTTVRQVSRLFRSYEQSAQKMREPPSWQADYDVAIYVPFLPLAIFPNAHAYMHDLDVIRAATRTYAGPAIWFLWHTLAARIRQIESTCGTRKSTQLVEAYKRMLSGLMLTHPCPVCREHLLTQVTRNDVLHTKYKLGTVIKPTVPASTEAQLYPPEYLFVGGAERSTWRSKLESIRDGGMAMLFAWKLHNALNSQVPLSLTCTVEERVDAAPYGCSNNSSVLMTADDGRASTKDLGRAWPTAKRFERGFLGRGKGWAEARELPALRKAVEKLASIPLAAADEVRGEYWSGVHDRSKPLPVELANGGKAVAAASKVLDEAMLATGVLYDEYRLSAPLLCHKLVEPGLVDDPLASLDDFEPMPEGCIDQLSHPSD